MTKKLARILPAAVLSAALAVGTLFAAPANAAEVVDYDSFTEALETDYSQAAQLPLTGYFKKNVAEGRTVKVYISEEVAAPFECWEKVGY